MPDISMVDYPPLLAASAWLDLGVRTSMATIVAIDGKSPRTIGAQMAVAESGLTQGYLTGGCLEAEFSLRAKQVMADGANSLERYGKGSKYFDLRLPCGSGIDIYFDQALRPEVLQAAQSHMKARQPFGIEIALSNGVSTINDRLNDYIQLPMDAGRFQRLYLPPVRTLVFGSGAAPIQLASLLRFFGMQAELKATDTATLDQARAQGLDASILRDGNDLPQLDAWTACVLAFHEHVLELPLLHNLLHSPAFYIGAVGSKSVGQTRRDRLIELGFSPEQLARIIAPAGAVRGARSATELAVGLLAEILDSARQNKLVV
ncbi:MAG: XdhC family protein [Devosia sp.]